MFTHSDIFTVILLMDASLSIPAAIRTLIVASTRTKAACLARKTKRRERRQPGEPFGRIRRDVQFTLLRADEDVSASGSIFNEWNETASLLCRMANQRRHGWLARHGERRASQQSKGLFSGERKLGLLSQQKLLCVLALLEQLQRQVHELCLQRGDLSFHLHQPRSQIGVGRRTVFSFVSCGAGAGGSKP